MQITFASAIWLGLVIFFALLELATVGLVCIWFAAGAVAALLVSAFVDSVFVQVIVFLVVSFAALAITRPLVVKARLNRPQPTNADRNIGRKAIVIVPILPDVPGRVRLDGVDWAARSEESLPKDTLCVVQNMDGATLTVCSETAAVKQPVAVK